MTDKCDRCKAEQYAEQYDAERLHTCPYLEDIGGDSETLCNCCGACEYQCAMDI